MPRDHFIECDQHPKNEQHYPCSCESILDDLREHAMELAFDSMRDDT